MEDSTFRHPLLQIEIGLRLGSKPTVAAEDPVFPGPLFGLLPQIPRLDEAA